MNRKLLLTLLGASAALVMAVGTTQAAPASSAGETLRSTAQNQSVVQGVDWRRHCHCHRWGCHRRHHRCHPHRY